MTKPYKLLVLMAETDIKLMLIYDETLQTCIIVVIDYVNVLDERHIDL